MDPNRLVTGGQMGRFHHLIVDLKRIKRDQHGRNCRVRKGKFNH